MTETVCTTAVLGLMALTAVVLAGQSVHATTHPWWRDQGVQRELALSSEQVEKLDAIFARDRSLRIDTHNRIDRLGAELRRMIQDEADESSVMRVSDSLEALRQQQNTRRSLMLLAMYRVLTPPQRAKLVSGSRDRTWRSPGR